jgi:stress-induced-phosphoprotein 1
MGMDNYKEALQAYEEALKYEPDSSQIKQSIKDCKANMSGSSSEGVMNPFADDGIWEKLKSDPKTREYLKDPGYTKIIESLHKSPKDLGKYMQDSRVMTTLGVLLGVQLQIPTDEEMRDMEEEAKAAKSNSSSNAPPTKQSKSAGDAGAKKEPASPADAEKELGNAAYKVKDFSTATKHYLKAIELSPDNIVYRNNLAAVHFEEKNYDECIKVCMEAVDIGREHRADYKLIAKALSRIGSAYHKLGDLKNALAFYNKSLSEHRDPDIIKRTHELQKTVAEQERLAYIDPAKSLEEKNKGNELFQKGDYPKALVHYSEAIKRNPDDAKLYSNRAACYTKLLEFSMAIRDSDECIRLDPSFVKGYLRKAASLVAMKETTRAADAYQKALEIDPNCQEALDGYRSCMKRDSSNPDAVRRQAMQDPEVQQILADPAMQMILQQMQKDPKALQEHLKNPDIAKKIEKLLEVGVIGFR